MRDGTNALREAEYSRLLTTSRPVPRDEAHTLTTHTRACARTRVSAAECRPPLGSRRAARRAPDYSPPATKRMHPPSPLRRLADSLAGVGQETLNQGDLLTANLALTAQALLVARAHVGVQVLLPRAPVQNLFRARIGKKKGGEARRSAAGSGRKERGAPWESGRLLRATLLSVARAPPLAGWRTVPRSAFPSRRRFARMFSRQTSDEQTLNPIRRWMAYPRASGTRARARCEPRRRAETYLSAGGDLEPLGRRLVGLGLTVTGLRLGLAHRHRHRLGGHGSGLRGEAHGGDGLAETEAGDLRGGGEARGGHRERRHGALRT